MTTNLTPKFNGPLDELRRLVALEKKRGLIQMPEKILSEREVELEKRKVYSRRMMDKRIANGLRTDGKPRVTTQTTKP